MIDRYDPIADIETRALALNVAVVEAVDRAGVARSTWHRWRGRRQAPNLDTVNRIIAALDALAAETASRMRAVGYAPTAPPEPAGGQARDEPLPA